MKVDRVIQPNNRALDDSNAVILESASDRCASFPSNCLMTLFDRFNDLGITYCVLRNFEELSKVVDDDVDILVRPEDLQPVEAIVITLLTDSLFLVRRTVRNGHSMFQLASKEELEMAARESRPAIGLLLDFQTGFEWMGMTYMDAHSVLVQRQKYGTFYIPGLQYQASHVLGHAILDKGYVKSGYLETINRSISQFGKDSLAPLTPFIGDAMVSRLYSWLIEEDVEQIFPIRRALTVRLIAHRLSAIPSLIGFLIRKYMRIGRAILSPPGVLVTTGGPDGVGKSTLITGLGLVLSETIYPVKEQYMGWRQSILPTKHLLRLGRAALARRKSKKSTAGGSESTDGPLRMQSLSNLHYFIDLWARYLIQIRPELSRGSLVLCDRYFYDILANDTWLTKNRITRSLLLAMIPKPTVTVFFRGNPDVIVARKQEISGAEVERQLAEFSKLSSSIGFSLELDALDSVDQNVTHVVAAVIERLKRSGRK